MNSNTQGQRRVYDSLPWNHQAKFRLESFQEWTWTPTGDKSKTKKKGGEYKTADKLAFLDIDEAGHTSPGDQKEAVAFVVKCWLTSSEDEGCPKWVGAGKQKLGKGDDLTTLYEGRVPQHIW
jgi:carboxypeptidase C (cathepsin A)